MLRFYACWDDTRRPCGDKMPFVLHYYLVDHTMEVREVRLRNDGRDPFPLLVRRMPFPKKVRLLYLTLMPIALVCALGRCVALVRTWLRHGNVAALQGLHLNSVACVALACHTAACKRTSRS